MTPDPAREEGFGLRVSGLGSKDSSGSVGGREVLDIWRGREGRWGSKFLVMLPSWV